MQASAALLLHSVPSSIIPNTDPKPTALGMNSNAKAGTVIFRHERIGRSSCNKYFSACRASQQSPITEFNLYELLGIDSSSDKNQIKEAYRALQKRCHPDIAGPPGHDMAIVLNEAYALLSDPISRIAYDRELAKVEDLQGYTGRPIYSTWCGSESEERAVFVDEVKCIGCLKCALFAQNTFAVESVFGRARVVAQWADPENQIHDAVGACPVDCISFVERSNLPALEFIMSKQPRGKVRIGASNTAGARTADVFDEVEKFQARYAKHTASKSHSKDSEAESDSRMSAVQAIQMISNWLYWKSPSTHSTPSNSAIQKLQRGARDHAPPSLKKLKAAAQVRKQATTTKQKETSANYADYWVPTPLALPQSHTPPASVSESQADLSPSKRQNPPSRHAEVYKRKKNSRIPFGWVLPIGSAVVAAALVNVNRLELGEPVTGIQNHVAGSLALVIVNSSWMQVALAGLTWYLIGMYMLEMVEALRRK